MVAIVWMRRRCGGSRGRSFTGSSAEAHGYRGCGCRSSGGFQCACSTAHSPRAYTSSNGEALIAGLLMDREEDIACHAEYVTT